MRDKILKVHFYTYALSFYCKVLRCVGIKLQFYICNQKIHICKGLLI